MAIKLSLDDQEIEIKNTSTDLNASLQSNDMMFHASGNVNVSVYEEPSIKINPLMRRTSYQARLGKRLDRISRKLIDNQIRLTSHPTDMLRIAVERDPRSQDLISRTVKSAEVLPIILPPMKDIPMRRFMSQDNEGVLLPSLYPTSETTYYELYAPMEVKLDEDDLLLRIIEEPGSDTPYVLCLQIKEILGTLGYSSFRYQKFYASLYDEQLPKKVIELLHEAMIKRDQIGW